MADYSKQTCVPLDLSGKRFAVVVSTYNDSITDNLLLGALATLSDRGATTAQIDVFHVPGAWELALGTKVVVETGRYHGVVSLGCVIRGETTHDQYINTFVSQALGQLSLQNNLPIAFGLLTCNTLEQAQARSGGGVGNKGNEATTAMLDMIRLIDTVKSAT